MAANPPTLTLRLVKEEPLTASEMDTNLTDLKTYALDVETQILNGTGTFTDNVISGDIIDGGTISNFSSTGIDDNADANALTIDSAEKATFSGELAVTGASEFTGEITATGGVAGNSSTATKVYVTDNESTAENNLIAFLADAGDASGNHALEMDGELTYNPNASTLSVTNIAATSLTGALTGNVTGNVTGTLDGVVGGTTPAAITGTTIGGTVITASTNFAGPITGNVTGDLTGTVLAACDLENGVDAHTQAAGNNSTKVATTAYVDSAGVILQVLAAPPVTDITFEYDTDAMGDITDLDHSITPIATSSTVLVQVVISFGAHVSNHVGFGLKRDGVQIGSSTHASGDRQNAIAGSVPNNNDAMNTVSFQYMDSPSTTSSVTYQATVTCRSGHEFMLNRTFSNTDAGYTIFGISTITLTEVSG